MLDIDPLESVATWTGERLEHRPGCRGEMESEWQGRVTRQRRWPGSRTHHHPGEHERPGAWMHHEQAAANRSSDSRRAIADDSAGELVPDDLPEVSPHDISRITVDLAGVEAGCQAAERATVDCPAD